MFDEFPFLNWWQHVIVFFLSRSPKRRNKNSSNWPVNVVLMSKWRPYRNDNWSQLVWRPQITEKKHKSGNTRWQLTKIVWMEKNFFVWRRQASYGFVKIAHGPSIPFRYIIIITLWWVVTRSFVSFTFTNIMTDMLCNFNVKGFHAGMHTFTSCMALS